MRHGRLLTALLAVMPAVLGDKIGEAGDGEQVGVNVLFDSDVTPALLDSLAAHGTVLEAIPQVRAVTVRAAASKVPAIRCLPHVLAADPDAPRFLAGTASVPVEDFATGASLWNLDAIDVTEADGERTVDATGDGVYVAVLDSGLPNSWRAYFPEERIDAVHARAFLGGGGERGAVTSDPSMWEHATNEHATGVVSVILGFQYAGAEALPRFLGGVAPRANVIPIKFFPNGHHGYWSSAVTRALVYLADLKAGGELGTAPLVVNMSFGGPDPDDVERAAIDYAIAQGVVIVACAHNQGESGMWYPGAYAPVVSVANVGWVRQFPADDPTLVEWVVRDVEEGDAAEYFVSPDSGRELSGQDLDVAAPGWAVPVAWTESGRVDYNFFVGTSAASPHVAGVAALLLERNPGLGAADVEAILEGSALPLGTGCRSATFAAPILPGNPATWGDHDNVVTFPATVCWGANATGHGLVQATAALAATPAP